MADVKTETHAGIDGVDSKGNPAVLSKEGLAAWRTNFDLHVLLLMKRHKLGKPAAIVQAYHEGVDGLNKRLG